MIYILAPFSFNINTTARNRIISFYNALKADNFDVIILSPYPVNSKDKLFIHSSVSSSKILESNDLVYLPVTSWWERLLFTIRNNSNAVWSLLNFLNLAINGCDLNYPSRPINKYFEHHPWNEGDIIIASAPPFSVFKAALSVSKKYNFKLILDYRHIWTYGYSPIDNSAIIGRLKRYFGRKHEKAGLSFAAIVNCDGASAKRFFPAEFQDKVQIVRNGANLNVIEQAKITEHYSVFRIVYLGTIYNDQLVDETFFIALQAFIRTQSLIKGELEVIFVGSDKNKKLHATVAKYHLQDFVIITPRVELVEAMDIAYTAAAFLHLRYHKHSEVDTSKHLDYLALQKPILLPSTDNGNIAKSIKEYNAGFVCEDTQECKAAIRELWLKHQKGESMKTPRTTEFLYSISREAEAQKVVESVKKIIKLQSDIAE